MTFWAFCKQQNFKAKTYLTTFWVTFGNIWTTFYSNIWSHCSKRRHPCRRCCCRLLLIFLQRQAAPTGSTGPQSDWARLQIATLNGGELPIMQRWTRQGWIWLVVVAQLAEQLLLTPEVFSSNSFIGTFLCKAFIYSWKTKIKKTHRFS